jgi:4-amino-4-deoxy-L-arabinose transferase-like glycosyltransferase
MKRLLKNNWAFIGTLILGILLRVLFLSDVPYRIDGDTSLFAIEGLKALVEKPPFFSTGSYGIPNGYYYLIGIFAKSFADQVFGIRFLSAIGGILGVVATYLFAKKLFNKKVALWAALFLAVSPYHLVLSRIGIEAVWMTFFAPFVIFLILYKKPSYIFLGGVFTGLSQYFYPAARLIPILAGTLFIILFLKKKLNIREFIINSGIVFLGFVIIYLPMILYFYSNPENYWDRVNPVLNTNFISWQVLDRFLVFFKSVETAQIWYMRDRFLDLFSAVLFLGGLLKAAFNIKKWQYLFIYFYFFLGVFFLGVITSSISASRYTIVFPVVAVFVGIGINSVLELIKRKAVIPVMVLILVILGSFSYWKHDTQEVWNDDYNTQIATYAGRHLAKIPYNYTIYFVGDSSMYYEAVQTLPFLTKKKGVDINQSVGKFLEKTTVGGSSFFIIIPSRKNEINVLRQNFPKGTVREFYNPAGEFLFWLYEV